MAAINNDWAEALKEEYKKPYYRELYKKVNEEYQTHEIFPPSDEIFSAFHLTPLKDVKVVILGQDPYQFHIMCPIERYISGIKKIREIISLFNNFGVSVSAKASAP